MTPVTYTDPDPIDWAARPEWQTLAACRGMGTELFFPSRGDTSTVVAALQVCAGCPVRAECEKAGRNQPGIWGGLSDRARRRNRGPRLADCKHCGERFVADHSSQRYCSLSCRKAVHNLATKTWRLS